VVVLFRPHGIDAGEIDTLGVLSADYGILDGMATAYVCQNFQCNLPTTDVDEMIRQLHGK
jgi:uncharacterized protein YyaL (SSP411 family)